MAIETISKRMTESGAKSLGFTFDFEVLPQVSPPPGFFSGKVFFSSFRQQILIFITLKFSAQFLSFLVYVYISSATKKSGKLFVGRGESLYVMHNELHLECTSWSFIFVCYGARK